MGTVLCNSLLEMGVQSFKVDRLSRFRTEARQVFTTHKLFPSEIPLTMKTVTSNSI